MATRNKTPAPAATKDPRNAEATTTTTAAKEPASTEITSVKRRPTKAESERVSVTIPKAFKLMGDDHTLHHYDAGIQDMPRHHADHWYSKAHGVTINE